VSRLNEQSRVNYAPAMAPIPSSPTMTAIATTTAIAGGLRICCIAADATSQGVENADLHKISKARKRMAARDPRPGLCLCL